MISTRLSPECGKIVSQEVTTKIALVLEYDGTRYNGFQLQVGLPTIQGEIEKALWRLTGEESRVIVASRTDAGVHARGQVASFRTKSTHSPKTFIEGLNYYLPRDIVVKASCRVGVSFNVRRNAVSREYHYYMLNSPVRSPLREGFAYRVAGRLDIEAMNQACHALIGEHDFVSFASRIWLLKDTVRKVHQAEASQDGEMVFFRMVADSFLPHQVRNTVGSLIKVGLSKMSVDEFSRLLLAKKPGLAGPPAPARGLCLMQVNYPYPFEKEI